MYLSDFCAPSRFDFHPVTGKMYFTENGPPWSPIYTIMRLNLALKYLNFADSFEFLDSKKVAVFYKAVQPSEQLTIM